MRNLMRLLTVMLILQATVLCYSLYLLNSMESTIDCASLVDAQGEE